MPGSLQRSHKETDNAVMEKIQHSENNDWSFFPLPLCLPLPTQPTPHTHTPAHPPAPLVQIFLLLFFYIPSSDHKTYLLCLEIE